MEHPTRRVLRKCSFCRFAIDEIAVPELQKEFVSLLLREDSDHQTQCLLVSLSTLWKEVLGSAQCYSYSLLVIVDFADLVS